MRACLSSLFGLLLLASCGGKPQVSAVDPGPALELLQLKTEQPVLLSMPDVPLGQQLRIAGSPTGEFYLLDTEHHRVLRYSKEGKLEGDAGGLGTGPGQFNSPVDLDMDGQMIWILDRQNRRLVRLNHALNYVEEIPLTPSSEDLSKPLWYDGVSAASNGDVFLLDKREPQAVRISSNGDVLASYGGFQTGNGRLERPTDLDAGQDGSLFVTDGNRLLLFDRSGNVQKEIHYSEPLSRVEAFGKSAWITTVSGKLLHYDHGTLTQVVAPTGKLPVSIDLTLDSQQEPVLLDSEGSMWLLSLPAD